VAGRPAPCLLIARGELGLGLQIDSLSIPSDNGACGLISIRNDWNDWSAWGITGGVYLTNDTATWR